MVANQRLVPDSTELAKTTKQTEIHEAVSQRRDDVLPTIDQSASCLVSLCNRLQFISNIDHFKRVCPLSYL